MKLHDELPVDHRLARVYRFGAGAVGVCLLVFGILALVDQVDFFGTTGKDVAGLSSNGALGLLSIAIGLILVAGAFRGGDFASTLNITVGVLFVLSGFVNLALLGKDANVLGFTMANVIFSFVVGLVLMVFGMYGRVGSALPHDNPYWRSRHAQQAAREDAARQTKARGLPGGRVSAH